MLKILKFIFNCQLFIKRSLAIQTENLSTLTEQLVRIENLLRDTKEREIIYLNAKEVEEFVGFSDSSLRRYQDAGKIKIAKIGKNRTRYFNKSEIIEFKKWYWNLPSDFT
ncbi:helix-turn-helix transcriptional regulator [Sphingobacterium tabacisoli]|uniref:Helix-turn-helix transcriptional regulator n=1 Tax=Sphingobacterium tabacisoli TaxID=2044855 RepID=A0ABW5L8L8_9SPHI|nr:helix-turn-helix domain-containing protein [Sphingobacterium tabacisoli]